MSLRWWRLSDVPMMRAPDVQHRILCSPEMRVSTQSGMAGPRMAAGKGNASWSQKAGSTRSIAYLARARVRKNPTTNHAIYHFETHLEIRPTPSISAAVSLVAAEENARAARAEGRGC